MKDFLDGMILDRVTELGRSNPAILPPASFLIKIDIKGERGSHPRLDGLFHFLRKTILHVETDLPDPIPAFHKNILDVSFLAESREGKDQDEKKDNPSNQPSVLTSMSHSPHLKIKYEAIFSGYQDIRLSGGGISGSQGIRTKTKLLFALPDILVYRYPCLRQVLIAWSSDSL